MACCGQLYILCGPDFTVGICVCAVDSFFPCVHSRNYLNGSGCDKTTALSTFSYLTEGEFSAKTNDCFLHCRNKVGSFVVKYPNISF